MVCFNSILDSLSVAEKIYIRINMYFSVSIIFSVTTYIMFVFAYMTLCKELSASKVCISNFTNHNLIQHEKWVVILQYLRYRYEIKCLYLKLCFVFRKICFHHQCLFHEYKPEWQSICFRFYNINVLYMSLFGPFFWLKWSLFSQEHG